MVYSITTSMAPSTTRSDTVESATRSSKVTGREREETVYRSSVLLSGDWYFDNNLDGIVNRSFKYGGSGDQILAGKWA